MVILYIREYLCLFTKLFTGTRVSKDFQFQVSCSRNKQKRSALIFIREFHFWKTKKPIVKWVQIRLNICFSVMFQKELLVLHILIFLTLKWIGLAISV